MKYIYFYLPAVFYSFKNDAKDFYMLYYNNKNVIQSFDIFPKCIFVRWFSFLFLITWNNPWIPREDGYEPGEKSLFSCSR